MKKHVKPIVKAIPQVDQSGKFRYFHTACANTAFFLTRMPDDSDPVTAADVIKNDGSKPAAGETIVCGSCLEPISTFQLENIIPVLK